MSAVEPRHLANRSSRWQEDQGQVFRDGEFACGVLPGAIKQQDGMRSFGYRTSNLVEVELHGLGVGVRHGERRAGAAHRTDGAEQVALIGWLARP